MGACDGFRVLELSDGACAASLCGQLFAGLGADVLKVETGAGDTLRRTAPLAPDGTGYGFHIANASKGSVLIEDGPGLEARLLELARSADVILIGQNLPAALRRTTRQWSDVLPDKVVCALTPFGEESVRSGWLGNELINEAMGGLLICTGYPERPPVISGMPYAEHMTALCGFSTILAALWERAESGQGQRLDISVADMMVTVLGNFAPAYFLSGRSPRRIGNRHTIAAPWNLFPTADGHVVICVGGGDRSWWRDLAALIGHPELGDDQRFDRVFKRVERVEEVDALVSAWTRRHTTAEVAEAMDRLNIPVGEVTPLEAVLAEPQYAKTRAMIGWTGTPEKPIAVPGLPFKVGTWNPPSKPGPMLGSCRTWPERRVTPATAPRRPAGADPRPLAGIRALEFGSRTSAPMAGRLLADLGADVVKIEPPKGESLRGSGQQVAGTSYLFHINNAGKESFVVEPKSRQGRELILRLAAEADVWFENLTPGSLDAIGLGYKDLKAVNPEIIYCSVSGFGRVSDYGNKKALELGRPGDDRHDAPDRLPRPPAGEARRLRRRPRRRLLPHRLHPRRPARTQEDRQGPARRPRHGRCRRLADPEPVAADLRRHRIAAAPRQRAQRRLPIRPLCDAGRVPRPRRGG